MNKIFISFIILPFVFLLAGGTSLADVTVIDVDGVVNPVMSEFISDNIENAEKDNADALVIRLDTPGGLDTSMRSIVKKIISSEIPVVVYVSPSGARAASAGVFITIAAHIAAMSPGTNIGAAHPVGVGSKMDQTMTDKAVNDASAYIKSIAEKRNRHSAWAEKAVRESASITDRKKVETSLGKHVLSTKGAAIVYKKMGLRQKILDIISNPNVAYMLMLLGFYGIFFELNSPGTIFPGVIGVISLILAFYSFQTLPVNYAGVLLITLGIILFILEIMVTSFGLLTIGGIISMTIGSFMLFDSPLPFLKLSLKVILPAVIVTAAFFSLTIYLALNAYRRKPVTGAEGLIGLEGHAKTDIHSSGQAFVHGEIWNARSDEPIKAGDRIIVEKVENLLLKVRRHGISN
jgi:membrane-bound serine protease (ClpP class)